MGTGSFKHELADGLRARGIAVESDVPIDRLVEDGPARRAARGFADGIAGDPHIRSLTISAAGKTFTIPGGASRDRDQRDAAQPDSDAPYPVPGVAAFTDPEWIAKGGIPGTPDAPLLNFIDAPDLAALAATIIAANPRDFRHFREPFSLTVDYSWRREGGKKAGRYVLGTCAKVSGTEEKHTTATWKIVLNADILRGRTNYQVEAVLHHELLHTGLTDKLKPTLIGHDVELFYRDIARYGFIFDDWRQLRDTVQLRLFEGNAGEGDE